MDDFCQPMQPDRIVRKKAAASKNMDTLPPLCSAWPGLQTCLSSKPSNDTPLVRDKKVKVIHPIKDKENKTVPCEYCDKLFSVQNALNLYIFRHA